MSYSLTAHSPYEGMRLVLNGTKGRIEINRRASSMKDYQEVSSDVVKINTRRGEEIDIKIPTGTAAGHGGADDKLRDQIFRDRAEDPLGQMADVRAGMMSIGIGMAANLSMKENRRVYLSEFYEELK